MTKREFESLANAAVAAMFWVDGRIEPTPSARVIDNDVIPTRAFKARLRKELKSCGIKINA